MIYGITDKPKHIYEYILYGLQQTLSVLTATILISNITGAGWGFEGARLGAFISAGMVGAGAATIAFLLLTKFRAPLFFSNSGSTVGAVIACASILPENAHMGVIVGGVVVFLMNVIASLIVRFLGSQWVNKLLPPVVAGTIVLVIGLNLAGFCLTYIGTDNLHLLVAFITMLITALVMRYGKGRLQTLPFLCGLAGGYIASLIFGLTDFSWVKDMSLFIKPDFAFTHLDFSILTWSKVLSIAAVFGAVNLANMGEHISDVLAVSSVVGEDLTQTVGVDKTLLGDGAADLIGTFIGGQPTTTYSESLSTIAVSKVASTRVILVAALMTITLGFFGPFNALIVSIPNCVFGGVAFVAYGCIAYAGLKTLLNAKETQTTKGMIIFAIMLTIGVSGVAFIFGGFSLTTIALSMITGLILNLIL